MYILQISDFHIYNEETEDNLKRYQKIAAATASTITRNYTRDVASPKEKILITMCGDIIDQKDPDNLGKTGGYIYAKRILNQLRQDLSTHFDVFFGFVPGNHDKVSDSLKAFFDFIAEYNFNWTEENSCFSLNLENINYVFINSIHDSIRRGSIDYETLERLLSDLDRNSKKVLILHHTIMSMDDHDASSIMNASKFVYLIEKYNVSLVLHGHTHGLDSIAIGSNQCPIIGVGALFSRNYPDVNSQFNMIALNTAGVETVTNYTYHFDNATTDETVMSHRALTIPWKSNHFFSGSKISEAYNCLIDSLKVNHCLYNIVLSGTYKFEDFEQDVEEHFGKHKDFEFDYDTLASKWQSKTCPNEIYFSHGQFYYDEKSNRSGIDYVIKMLQNKKTSSRAVLSTIGMKNIYSADDDSFLPSLMIIQFGFDNKAPSTLKITTYLRALEASRFFKINICEILLLARKIRNDMISTTKIDTVEITINAFRVQIKDNFNCFVKAELDQLPDEDIQDIVTRKDYARIINLLQGKNRHIETVVISTGIETLKRKLDWYCRTYEPYPADFIAAIKDITDKLADIRDVRKRVSIYSEVDQSEQALKMSIDKAIAALQKELA